MGLAFGPMDEMPFALEDADDGEDAVVMRRAGQPFLYIFDGRLAHLPDDFHNLQLFVGIQLGWFSRHNLYVFASTNKYVNLPTYLLVGIKRILKPLKRRTRRPSNDGGRRVRRPFIA